jgi:8-oxo-dGTP diphosphatase
MIQVTAAILIRDDRILIAQRLPDDKLAGRWEFPGGKIEDNETARQCLVREMKEEFGIDVAVNEFFAENTHRYAAQTIRLLAYRVVWQGGDFVLNAHAAVRWVPLNRLGEFEFAPADKPFVQKLQTGAIPG